MPQSRYVINSILRAFSLLELFTQGQAAHKFSQLERALGYNKATLTRLLASLTKADILQKDPLTREYRLTHRIFRIGNAYRDEMDLYKTAAPLMAELAQATGETVHLAILADFLVLYIGKMEGSQSVRIRSQIGHTTPCHTTGVGKAMLANLEPSRLEEFFRTVTLEKISPQTITDPDQLRVHLHQIKEQGFSLDDQEHEKDVRCVAAPIFNHRGQVVAALSVAGPVYRITSQRISQELAPLVREAARSIGRRQG